MGWPIGPTGIPASAPLVSRSRRSVVASSVRQRSPYLAGTTPAATRSRSVGVAPPLTMAHE